MYERLNMEIEIVESLANAGLTGEAKKKALLISDFEKNAKILCIYGELD